MRKKHPNIQTQSKQLYHIIMNVVVPAFFFPIPEHKWTYHQSIIQMKMLISNDIAPLIFSC